MWVYILKSIKNNKHKYYIGCTIDIYNRLKQHNEGLTISTKSGAPWKLIYKEKVTDRLSALRREKEIKSYHGGNAFKKLIGGIA